MVYTLDVQESYTFGKDVIDMNTQLILSSNIKMLIKDMGLKQKAVANKCGIDEKVFSNMLCNRQNIRTENLPLIAEALNVSVDQLFNTDKLK